MKTTKNTDINNTELLPQGKNGGACNNRVPQGTFQKLNFELLLECLFGLKRNARPGSDGVTVNDFIEDLDKLTRLLSDLQSGCYEPQALINGKQKINGKKRNIKISSTGDKVAQSAIARILEDYYHSIFKPSSFAYIRGRNQHGALHYLHAFLKNHPGSYVLELDISKYFDSIDHNLLQEILASQIGDEVIIKLISQWMTVDTIIHNKRVSISKGVPQGSVISSLLANIYLDVVLDDFLVEELQVNQQNGPLAVRYADDVLLVLPNYSKASAEQVLTQIEGRLSEFKLTVNAKKTKLKHFRKGAKTKFSFLGFTFSNRQELKVETKKSKMVNIINKIKSVIYGNKRSIEERYERLNTILQNHYNYYAILGNQKSLNRVFYTSCDLWNNLRSAEGVTDTETRLLRRPPSQETSSLLPIIGRASIPYNVPCLG